MLYVNVAIWFCICYVLISFIEWIIHGEFMHDKRVALFFRTPRATDVFAGLEGGRLSGVSNLWRRGMEWLYVYFEDIWREHNEFHHAECFTARKMDNPDSDACFEKNLRLRIGFGQVGSFFIWMPLYAGAFLCWKLGLVGLASFLATGGILFQVMLFLHHCAWNVIHLQMHTKFEKRMWLFQASRTWRWLARNHCVHHRRRVVNHCIVFPLADWIMGTYMPATDPKDLAYMRQLHLTDDTCTVKQGA